MMQHIEPQDNKETAPSPAGSSASSRNPNEVPEAGTSQLSEQELWRGRTSWKHFANRFILTLTWSIIALIVWFKSPSSAALDWLLAVLTCLAWVYVLFLAFLAIWGCRYRLTTQRLFIDRGLLSRTVDQTELIRVDDVQVYQSLLNRLLNVGSIQLMSTDMTDRQLKIIGVENPEKISEHIRESMRNLRQRRSLYVENL